MIGIAEKNLTHAPEEENRTLLPKTGESFCSSPCQRGLKKLETAKKWRGEKVRNDVEQRFWSKVAKGDADQCWPWTVGR